MAKKLLIVDDEKKYRGRFSGLVSDMDIEIIIAEGVKEGIEKALAEKPDAIVTDKDMQDGTGNDLAKAIKEAYNANIAGITGGNPQDFDEKVIDVRLSKSIRDSQYKALVNILLESDNPAKDYAVAVGEYVNEFVKIVGEVISEYAALDILVQGYMLGLERTEGKQPIENLKMKEISKEQANSLLDSEDIGIIADELHQVQVATLKQALESAKDNINGKNSGNLYDIADSFAKNKKINSFMVDITSKDFVSIEEKKEYKIFHEKFVELCGAYNKIRESK